MSKYHIRNRRDKSWERQNLEQRSYSFFVILLGAGAVLYAKNCMEQLAAYAVSLMDGAGQAQSQLAAMIASDVEKNGSLYGSRAYHNGRCGCGRHH